MPLSFLAGNATNDRAEGKRKGRPKADSQALKDIPDAVVEKRTFPCPYCEATFTSKTQLEKHHLWNHLERTLPAVAPPAENRVQKSAGKSGGKKRPAEGSASPGSHPKQAKVEKAVTLQRPENGEYTAVSQGGKEFQTTAARGGGVAATPAAQPSGSRGSRQQPHRQVVVQEEDPERMKHRRKQKTPKKFTGEQPSISGTFGLKGLVKAEDKAKAHRAKKLEAALSSNDEQKKKPLGSSAKKEALIHVPTSPEELWQRTINEKGEVACPTCSMITRKTILGLKKHMEVCQKGCVATFSSLMGYQYHQKRCGKQPSEVEKPVFSCPHCGKTYKSKAGHDYHLRSEHPPMVSYALGFSLGLFSPAEEGRTRPNRPPQKQETKPEASLVEDFERTPSGRIRRTSAQVAVFHLQEIAEDELAKDWTKRRMKDDLVPETKRLNYTRPGLPKLNPTLLESWKNEVKEKGHINCPNHCCAAIYSSVSGLKAHLANCNKGEHSVGKYRCLLCQKEFSSESGVKYHIIKTHSENWFRTSAEAIRKKKSREQSSPSHTEEKKKSTDGKKRGRKPKERLPEAFAKSKESTAGKTNHKKMTGSWQAMDCNPDGREKGSKTSPSKKGAAHKMLEK
uniref:Zinc finger protein 512B n=1 Tax=Varanus komodoensis TaxID=61221 RepID=A0A8D2J0N0_VARKO